MTATRSPRETGGATVGVGSRESAVSLTLPVCGGTVQVVSPGVSLALALVLGTPLGGAFLGRLPGRVGLPGVVLSLRGLFERVERDRPRPVDRLAAHDPDEPVPEGREAASRVYLVIRFDPHSADDDAIDLPRFVSLSWVIEKVKPLVQGEAEAIVEKLVADLEGTRREVELDIHAAPESV